MVVGDTDPLSKDKYKRRSLSETALVIGDRDLCARTLIPCPV